MGAIGDYIHLTYDGYAGVRHSKEPYLYEAGRVIKQHRNIFNRDVNNMTSKLIFKLQNEIDNKLNLINAIQSEYQGTKEYPAIDEISQELLQLVAEKMKSRWFDTDALMAATAGLLSGQGMYAGEAPNNPSATHLTSIQSHTLTTANQQLRQILEGTLNSIGFLLKKGLVSEEEISSQLMISQTKIDNFLHWLEEEHNSTYIRDSDILKVEIKKIFENIQNIITSDNKQLKYDIKVLIDAFIKSISSIKTVQNWKGDGGEAFTWAVVKMALNVAFKSVGDVEIVGSTGRSKSGINTLNFAEFLKDNYSSLLGGKGDNAKFEYGDFIASTDLTKANKIDVVLHMKNQSDLGISVKNYSTATMEKKGIENSVSNVWTLLQNENDDDFINHYLNLSSIKMKNLKGVKNNNYIFKDSNDREEAYKLIRQIIITKLLTGYNTVSGLENQVQGTAKLLVRYDDKGIKLANGKYGTSAKIYAMKDVLTKSLFARNRYNVKGFPEFLINNNKETTPEIRIHKIITELAIPVAHSISASDLQILN